MSVPVTQRRPRHVPTWQLTVAFWSLFALVLAARASGIADAPAVATFALIFASIAVEALPFILLGALVSAAVAAFVPDTTFARIARLPRALQVPGAAVCAFAFPVCECGSVPVGRRLVARGVHPSAAVTFMLAAPVVNPVVLASTWVAYGGGRRSLGMVAGRAALGLAAAVAAGVLVARGRGELLRTRPDADTHGHSHAHDTRGAVFAEHLAGDFLFMGKFLVLGAAISALLQTVVPQGPLSTFAAVAVVGPLVLMALAFMLSLCSEADAFVAASFVAFPLHAQLAFLAFGPLLDAKLAVLYGATFRRRFVLRVLVATVPVILVGSVAFGALT